MAYRGVPFEELGPPWHVPAPKVEVPMGVTLMPYGCYGIMLEMDKHKLERVPPNGWGLEPGYMDKELEQFFEARGYTRRLRGMWQKQSSAENVWLDMMDLRDIKPAGVFPTCVRNVNMFSLLSICSCQWLRPTVLGVRPGQIWDNPLPCYDHH
ncbi:hypothetical protein BJ165DRAFT_360549 [Panaeolus papilionaceus]|nr:hypothetical protein BJ165DRAFT_360549 [Panaeolus papilionaceus]